MDDLKKLKVLVSRKEDDDKMVHEFVDAFVNKDHMLLVRKHEDDQWIVELTTGKQLVVKGVDFDQV